MAYTEQITFLLFLKMADEQTKPPYNKPSPIPKNVDWQSLLKPGRRRAGDPLPPHPRRTRQAAGDARRDLQEGADRDPEPGHAAAADRRSDRPGEVVVDAGRREGRHLRRAAREERRGVERGRASTSRRGADQGDRRLRAARSRTTPSAIRPAAPAASCWRPTTTSSEHQARQLDKDQKKHLRDEVRQRRGAGPTRPGCAS